MNIRRARQDDMGRILDLLSQVLEVHAAGRPDLFVSGTRKYTDTELAEIIADDDRPIFVAEDESGWVAGYAFCVVEDFTNSNNFQPIRTLYIDDLCVDESARGTHVGSSLYRFVVDWAREHGFYNVTLNVWSCNPGAMEFYQHMGMTPFKVGMEQIL